MDDPNLIQVYDSYGRKLYITREQWRDNVLLGNLEQAGGNPEQLYGLLVGALNDGFAADVVPYAEQLQRVDPIPARGATILGIVYMENNRLDDAERVLKDFLLAYGEDGTVLTNLAKIYSRRGDESRAQSTLWHALEVDPNQENGLGWFIAECNDRDGEAAALAAYRRVAGLPQSWRAQLWLARYALQRKDLAAAADLYATALARAGHPVPADLLMQMSGDLGNHGHLAEIVRLVGPHFEPARHGLQVGNNLIKANVDLGHLDAAQAILGQLYALARPDWRETLSYWDTVVAKARIAERPAPVQATVALSLMSLRGPLWTRDSSLFEALLPSKQPDAQRVLVFGSTALGVRSTDKPVTQLSDGPGRTSRAAPLFLAEQIHLATDAVGLALIPWAENQGFALFGSPYEDGALCGLARKCDEVVGHVVGITVDASEAAWKLAMRVVRCADGQRIAEALVEAAADNPGPAVAELAKRLLAWLAEMALVRASEPPDWYQVPAAADYSDYLLRLEQQLAVFCAHIESFKGGGLSGEREILDGTLHLCLGHPSNSLTRILLAETVRHMQKARPEIPREYKDKVERLQSAHPLTGDAARLVAATLAKVFAEPT
jgi:tetratricopeptide (TPR) repeat protein